MRAKPKRTRTAVLRSELAIIFGKNVKRERLSLHLSQIELGVRTGSSGTYIGLIERAQAAVTLPKVEAICKALKRDASYMLICHRIIHSCGK